MFAFQIPETSLEICTEFDNIYKYRKEPMEWSTNFNISLLWSHKSSFKGKFYIQRYSQSHYNYSQRLNVKMVH